MSKDQDISMDQLVLRLECGPRDHLPELIDIKLGVPTFRCIRCGVEYSRDCQYLTREEVDQIWRVERSETVPNWLTLPTCCTATVPDYTPPA